MPAKTPAHLYRNRHGTFYFRFIVPLWLRDHIGQREVRISLQTEERARARTIALHLLIFLPKLQESLASMADSADDAPETQPPFDVAHSVRAARASATMGELRDQLAEARIQAIDKERAHRREVVAAQATAFESGELKGKKELEHALVFPWRPERTVKISELLSAYLKSLESMPESKRPRPKTIESYQKDIQYFIRLMGDLNIGAIDRATVDEYISLACKLPANIERKAEFKGKSVADLLKLGAEPQTESNVLKKVERAATMLNWALGERRKWGIDSNPFKDRGKGESKKRRPFTDEELGMLFQHKYYKTRTFYDNYAYWVIPIALYTGARLREIAQLNLEDFVLVGDTACITIKESTGKGVKDEQRLKNDASARTTPIHKDLLELGILRFVEQQRLKGETRLFPELNRDRRDGPGHAVSSWFSRFRKEVGLSGKQDTVFHSFRNGFISKLCNRQIPVEHIKPLVGHKGKTVIENVYWSREIAALQKTIDEFVIHEEIRRLIPAFEDINIHPANRNAPKFRPK